MGRKRGLVYGVGVNDADYATQEYEILEGERKHKWDCPYYIKWVAMLERCYSKRYHKLKPSYVGCSVCEDWKVFSKFRKWMKSQPWEGLHLDKDILFEGNKIYSPDTCVFVPQEVNAFLSIGGVNKCGFPLGVSFNKDNRRYRARCSNPFTKRTDHLGYFESPEEAHKAWRLRKYQIAVELSKTNTELDPRVVAALISRFRA